MGDMSYETNQSSKWYGAYYYDMVYEPSEDHYLLFGFNGTASDEYYKFVDVLSFDAAGEPVFGKEIFVMKEDTLRPDIKTRVSVPYAKTAVIACRYDSTHNMIIHDFTSESVTAIDGINMGKLPDGSYVAYEKSGKYWKKIDRLANLEVEEKKPDYNKKRDPNAPDLFGRRKKKN
jgi:hypothetical protein